MNFCWRIVLLFWGCRIALCFPSSNRKNDLESSNAAQLSRRNILYWPVGIGGAVVYGKLVSDAVGKLSRGDLVYPEDHERHVRDVISMASTAALKGYSENRPFRILEVGIGKDCRLIRRGLYDDAMASLSAKGVSRLQINGIDVLEPSPKSQAEANRILEQKRSSTGLAEVTLDFSDAGITSQSTFPSGWFDVVVCSLTLCSVDDQDAAIQEMKRLVRNTGGTFAYVEHVVVNDDEPYRVLDLQQKIFDPLQQIVADNCHLRRPTDANIARIFDIDPSNSNASVLAKERFLVDGMWPVSCQACGVIQLSA